MSTLGQHAVDHPEWGPVVKLGDISADIAAARYAVKAIGAPRLLWTQPGGDRVRRLWVRLADAEAARAYVMAGGRKGGAK